MKHLDHGVPRKSHRGEQLIAVRTASFLHSGIFSYETTGIGLIDRARPLGHRVLAASTFNPITQGCAGNERIPPDLFS
ncbi:MULTISPECIES: hypothetical protein [Pseudomonas]|uniref:hypothetical protein n=1 Tax=Pseudomonas TaxID=286 RepID=UPI00114677C9|nr:MULTISPECIES: hypothetical protein [Pseudomonas]UST57337.1 hypothetical protein NF672_18020 [Pseudomonas moraviensis]UST62549.1 hypothetical protein NF673_18140 [Pseudomonas moraviensis]WPC29539.1 hypothetical protein OE648_07155 [Pseudomonas moraviensis]